MKNREDEMKRDNEDEEKGKSEDEEEWRKIEWRKRMNTTKNEEEKREENLKLE